MAPETEQKQASGRQMVVGCWLLNVGSSAAGSIGCAKQFYWFNV